MDEIEKLNLLDHVDDINKLLARYGVNFNLYKNNVFKEQLFPFDAIPRVIEANEFDDLPALLVTLVMSKAGFL